MEELASILNSIESITLSEMDGVKLMDRTDTKFVFHSQQLGAILEKLSPFYKVLEVKGNRISKYESLYFDTPNFDLYHKHQRGKLNRYKIRYRKYVESNLNFFEVKFKNNKGRTIKDRVIQESVEQIIKDKANDLLNTKTPLIADGLEPKIWVNYSRVTLVNKTSPERVTIDLNLHFVMNNQVKYIKNIVIAEVKQDGQTISPFIKIMRSLHIRQGSISKYCFGIITFLENIKQNNFKPKLNLIKKITHVAFTNN